MSKNGSKPRTQQVNLTPGDDRLVRQVIAGTNLIKTYGAKATDATTNDRQLAAMSTALVMTLKQELKLTEDMGRAIALAMVAAYEYGREGGKGTE